MILKNLDNDRLVKHIQLECVGSNGIDRASVVCLVRFNVNLPSKLIYLACYHIASLHLQACSIEAGNGTATNSL